MSTIQGHGVVIDRPVEDVWQYMTDVSNMARWEDSGAVWKQLSEGQIGVGTPIQSSITKLGRTVSFDLRVVDFDLHKTFSVEAIAGRTRGTRISYLLAPVEGRKTSLRRVTDARLHGLLKVLLPLVGFITRRTGDLEARNLKRLLEDPVLASGASTT
jgi:polyketide cyclase/dehydrase/lipid transport protein